MSERRRNPANERVDPRAEGRAGPESPVVAAALRMAAEHGLAPKERVPLVFAARGIPRALFARESGAREAAVKAAVRRALDKLGAHSLRDVVETLLRQLDADRRR